jgi:rhamnosyltransferase
MDQNNTLPIHAVIVTYNGQNTICDTLKALVLSGKSQYLKKIIIMDNQSGDVTISVVKSLNWSCVEIISLKKNIGVAGAYNRALKKAVEENVSWLLFLDQDSCLAEGSLDILVQTAREMTSKGHFIAAVCPQVYCAGFPEIVHSPLKWTGKGFEPVVLGDLKEPFFIDSSITSGTLYNVEALEKAGGFRKDFFIDFVDHECHWRLQKNGSKIVYVPEAKIYHNLGKIQRITDQGLWIEHDPYRYYYMARNMFCGYFAMGGVKAVVPLALEIYRHCKKLIRYGSNPGQSIFYILKGLGHACIGRMNKL